MDIVISDPNRRANPLLSRIKLVQGSIVEQNTDAVLSLLPQNLEFRGEINLALAEASGEDLDEYILDHVYKPLPGQVHVIPGFKLPCKNILFGITPNWRADFEREDVHLLSVVRKALDMMPDLGLKSIAIPPVGSGRHGFPKSRGARLIAQAVTDRINEEIEEVRITCLKDSTIEVFREKLLSYGWNDLEP